MDGGEGSPARKAGFNPDYFPLLQRAERRHFWFRARNRALRAVLGSLPLPESACVLEVGCGTGNSLALVAASFPHAFAVGLDRFAEGLKFARERVDCSLVQAEIATLPFNTGFDLICVLDVLEHVPDDMAVLRGLRGALSDGGRLLVTVPAEPALWSYFDEAAGHQRRYRESELAGRLAEAGFTVEYLTPFMAAIYPLVRLIRGLKKTCTPMDPEARDALTARELRVVPVVNGCLEMLLRPECALLRRRDRLPFGTSLMAVARKA
jgi:SAM-dependent methyltransferase